MLEAAVAAGAKRSGFAGSSGAAHDDRHDRVVNRPCALLRGAEPDHFEAHGIETARAIQGQQADMGLLFGQYRQAVGRSVILSTWRVSAA